MEDTLSKQATTSSKTGKIMLTVVLPTLIPSIRYGKGYGPSQQYLDTNPYSGG
jgi:hypothetical protein